MLDYLRHKWRLIVVSFLLGFVLSAVLDWVFHIPEPTATILSTTLAAGIGLAVWESIKEEPQT